MILVPLFIPELLRESINEIEELIMFNFNDDIGFWSFDDNQKISKCIPKRKISTYYDNSCIQYTENSYSSDKTLASCLIQLRGN